MNQKIVEFCKTVDDIQVIVDLWAIPDIGGWAIRESVELISAKTFHKKTLHWDIIPLQYDDSAARVEETLNRYKRLISEYHKEAE